MANKNTSSELLNCSDTPQTNPEQDLYGYAPFAKRIAEAIHQTPCPQGIVIGINGAWGSGKTSALNFVKYYLDTLPKQDRPIVIEFNPWWFEGREQLAAQFLSQFRSKLPHENEALRSIGDTIADYSEAIGAAYDFFYAVPLLGKLAFLLKFLKRKPKNVPALKAEISKALKESGTRFLFIIDDVDRLAPDEMRELFKVVKALGDFPNVIYMLAFDHNVVVNGLSKSLEIDGAAYLEKIVQAGFSMPSIDRGLIQTQLFQKLDFLLTGLGSPSFDKTYWGNVFVEGIAPFLQKPRDVTRLANILSVTFPAVCGEVDFVDFIAIESLRLFLPKVYEVIRDNPDQFAGHTTERSNADSREAAQAFHRQWIKEIPEKNQASIRSMMERLFPKISRMGYSAEWLSSWRKDRHICHPDVFPIYFEFNVSSQRLSKEEISELINKVDDGESAEKILLNAVNIKRPDGSSKAKEYLEQVLDYDKEITPPKATAFVNVLGKIGDQLIIDADEIGGFLAIRSTWRLLWVLLHALDRIDEAKRTETIVDAFRAGSSITLLCCVIAEIEKCREKQVEHGNSAIFAKMPLGVVSTLKEIGTQRIRQFAADLSLLKTPELPSVLLRWKDWLGVEESSKWVKGCLDNFDHLFSLLYAFIGRTKSQSMGDAVGKIRFTLNLKLLSEFIDLNLINEALTLSVEGRNLTDEQKLVITTFTREYGLIKQGTDPNSPRAMLEPD